LFIIVSGLIDQLIGFQKEGNMDVLLYLKLRYGEYLPAKNIRAVGLYAFRGGCSQVFWKTEIGDYPRERHGYFHHFISSLS